MRTNHRLSLLMALSLVILTITSCLSTFFQKRAVGKKSQICFFSNSKNDIDSFLDIDGFYRCDSNYYSWYGTKNLLLYCDNSFEYFRFSKIVPHVDSNGQTMYYKHPSEDVQIELDGIDLNENIESWQNKPRGKWGGAYSINDNCMVMEHPVIFNDKIVLCRNYFKIVDRHTLKREVFQIVSDDTIIQMDTTAIFRFHPAHNIPDSRIVRDKKRKWMWKSKEDWKQYKVLRKEYGKSPSDKIEP